MSTTPHSTGRTVLRGFLLLGGLAILGLGVVRGSTFYVGLGILAAALGGFGLWWELYHRPSADTEEP